MKVIKNLFLYILFFSLIFVGDNDVFAATLDVSNVTYEFVQLDDQIHEHCEIKIKDFNFNSDLDNYSYYLTITDNDVVPKLVNDDGYINPVWVRINSDGKALLNEKILTIYESNAKKLYLWIAEEKHGDTINYSNSIELSRVNLFPLGNRIFSNIINGNEVISLIFKDLVYTKDMIQYKIGEITDSSLVNSINSGNVDMNKLVTFVKNDSNGKSDEFKISTDFYKVYNKINNYKNNTYYYVYYYFDDFDYLYDVNYYYYEDDKLLAGKMNDFSGIIDDEEKNEPNNDNNSNGNINNNNNVQVNTNPSTSGVNVWVVCLVALLLLVVLIFIGRKISYKNLNKI